MPWAAVSSLASSHCLGLRVFISALLLYPCASSSPIPGTRPQVSIRPGEDLPEYGPNDIVFLLSVPTHYNTPADADDSLYDEQHDLDWNPWAPYYEFPFLANLALLAFKEGSVLQGPKTFSGMNFHVIFVDECPKGPGPYGEECGTIYGLRQVYKHLVGTCNASHPRPKAVIGDSYDALPAARLQGLLGITTIGFGRTAALSRVADKDNFPYYVRAKPAVIELYRSMIRVLKYWNYTTAFLFYSAIEDLMEARDILQLDGAEQGISVSTGPMDEGTYWFEPPQPGSAKHQHFTELLTAAQDSQSHVFIMAAASDTPFVEVLLWMKLQGMMGSGYLWMTDYTYLNWFSTGMDIIHSLHAGHTPYYDYTAIDGFVSFHIQGIYSGNENLLSDLRSFAQLVELRGILHSADCEVALNGSQNLSWLIANSSSANSSKNASGVNLSALCHGNVKNTTARNTSSNVSIIPPEGLGSGVLEDWLADVVQPWYWKVDLSTAPVGKEAFFDGFWALLLASNELILEQGPDFSSSALLDKLTSVEFEGLSGRVAFNSKGERVIDIDIEQIQPPCVDGQRLMGEAPYVAPTIKKVGFFDTRSGELRLTGPFLFANCSTAYPPDKDLPCEPGTYYHHKDGICVACEAGSFASKVGQSSCESCRPGTFGDTRGASDCTSCAPGSFSDTEQATACLQCAIGTFQNAGKQSACMTCGRGHASAEIGSSACDACVAGRYSSEQASTTCSICPFNLSTSGSGAESVDSCVCPATMYNIESLSGCMPCAEGISCPFGSSLQNLWSETKNNTVTDMQVDGAYPSLMPGYWSDLDDPIGVFKCANEARCPGGRPGTCGPGLHGRACERCSEGQFWDGQACRGCAADEISQWLFPWVPLMAIPVGVLIMYRFHDGAYKSWRKWNRGLMALAFVLLTHVQVLGLLTRVNVMCPHHGNSMQAAYLLVDWLSLFRIECSSVQSIFDKVLIRVLAPAVLAAWCILLYVVSRIVFPVFGCFRLREPQLFNIVMTVLVAFFSAIAATSLSMFQCQENPNGTSTLKDDHSVICWEAGEWHSLMGITIAAVGVYCIGFGAVMVAAMIRAPRYFSDQDFRTRWMSLFIRYRLDAWWWAFALFAKNLFVNLAFVVSEVGIVQLYTIILTVFVYTLSIVCWRPYRTTLANYLEVVVGGATVGFASILTNFAHGLTLSRQDQLDIMMACGVAIPLCIGISLQVHVAVNRFREWSSSSAEQSSSNRAAFRMSLVASALGKLNRADLAELLYYVDESERQAIRKTLSIIEAEGIGKWTWRLSFREPSSDGLDSFDSENMSGGTPSSECAPVRTATKGSWLSRDNKSERTSSGRTSTTTATGMSFDGRISPISSCAGTVTTTRSSMESRISDVSRLFSSQRQCQSTKLSQNLQWDSAVPQFRCPSPRSVAEIAIEEIEPELGREDSLAGGENIVEFV